ncbi:LysR family transcriptional regulator [Pararhodobacter zhoushanensis]|uniref:LysR family transcriptional regulator n=1 Tax=Pararhodobacter zhoushanensis TaxID=2479545 RepID=A0ABT3GV49_9RHOB|nr:LysR family transcriptional regulator [Pararhodobacter zhoushanensis]MCW1931428.1 LysR family transcriptional regulator [Pararhodobacter zhoushanensis]
MDKTPPVTAAQSLGNEPETRTDALSGLRLLVVLDALLKAGSVSGAAQALDLSVPGVSRLLAQLRAQYDDPILVREGRRMVPSPLAGTLRRRVAALTLEARALLALRDADPLEWPAGDAPSPLLPPRTRQRVVLDISPQARPEGMPDPDGLLARLDAVSADAAPQTRLAAHIARLSGSSRQPGALSFAQAEDAFGILLRGEADPVQVGALLAGIQQRGAVGPELAGLVAAGRAALPQHQGLAVGNRPALDWPVHPSPRQRRPAWFLAAARLLADSGTPVLLHGYTPEQGPLPALLNALRIPQVATLPEAAALLRDRGIAYLTIEQAAPQMAALGDLYAVLGMRTIAQTGLRLLDPLKLGVTLAGVPFTGSGRLFASTLQHLRAGRVLTVLSQRDVAQATPHRWMPLSLAGPEGETLFTIPPTLAAAPEPLPQGYSPAEMLAALWQGRARDVEITATIRDSAALGLIALQPDLTFLQAQAQAQRLWDSRTAL